MKCCTRPNAGIVRHSGTMLPHPIGADYAVIVGTQEMIGLEAAVARISGVICLLT